MNKTVVPEINTDMGYLGAGYPKKDQIAPCQMLPANRPGAFELAVSRARQTNPGLLKAVIYQAAAIKSLSGGVAAELIVGSQLSLCRLDGQGGALGLVGRLVVSSRQLRARGRYQEEAACQERFESRHPWISVWSGVDLNHIFKNSRK